jgi:hypothetical protein
MKIKLNILGEAANQADAIVAARLPGTKDARPTEAVVKTRQPCPDSQTDYKTRTGRPSAKPTPITMPNPTNHKVFLQVKPNCLLIFLIWSAANMLMFEQGRYH